MTDFVDESEIRLTFTWLMTKLVSDFAGVSICPRKKALHTNESQTKLKILPFFVVKNAKNL